MNPHRASLSRHPLAHFAIAFALGIWAANYFSVWIVGAVCSALVIVALWTRRLLWAGVALLLAFGVAGAVLAVQERRTDSGNELAQFVGRKLVVEGVLNGPAEFGRDRLYLTLSVERVDVDGSSRKGAEVVSLVALFREAGDEASYRSLQLGYGARVRVVTTFSRTDNYKNPGVSPLSDYLDRKGYAASGVIKSSGSIQRLEDVPGFSLLAWLYEWRGFLQEQIHAGFDADTAGVLDAALLGNRYNLSRETAERFREGGTFHVLVISGLHISFIGGIVFLLARRFTKRRVLQFVVPAVVVWAY